MAENDTSLKWAAQEVSVRPVQCMLQYFTREYGRARLEQVWKEKQLPLPLAYLEDMSNFMSYAFLELFLGTMTEASGDPQFIEHAGHFMTSPQGLGFAYYLLRGFGTPQLAYRKTIELGSTYNRVGDFAVERSTDTELVLTYKSRVKELSRNACRTRIANFAAFPAVWDLPDAEVTESECQVNGAEACRYHLKWRQRPIVEWRRWIGILGFLGVGIVADVNAAFLLTLAALGFFVGAWLDTRAIAIRKTVELEENIRGLTQSVAEVQKQSAELFRANEELDQRVALRTKELEEALEKLKRLDALKTEFFANVSHELRTPLTLILAPVEDRLSRPMDEPQRYMFEGVRRNAQRLLRLIDDLLDLSRIDAGHLRLSPAAVDLSTMASQLGELFAGAAKARNINFVTEVGGPTTNTFGDAHRLDSILSNLLGNAVKFTPAGGTITLRVVESDTDVKMMVSDTGAGVASDDQERIFDRYFQVPNTDRPRGGVGIGLALARNLAELHQGTLTLRSEVGKGSTFTVTLPKGDQHFKPETLERRRVNREGTPARRATDQLGEPLEQVTPQHVQVPVVLPPASLAVTGQRARILVVEDHDELRVMLRDLLSPTFDVLVANDGTQGLEMAQLHRPDLVLSDVMMPGRSGPALCAAIKGDPQLQSIPVVLLTARGGTDAALEGFSSGADDFVEKPFHPRVLLARLHAQLRIKALSTRLASQARLSALDTLAAGVGHEIRNPLNAVVNGIRVMQTMETVDPALLQVISDCATDIERITGALLNHISPAEKGGIRPMDPTEGLESTLLLMKHRLLGVTVHREYEAHGRVLAPASELNQVFLSLIDNAIRAPSRNIWVRVADDAQGIKISVRDDGPGISPEVAGQLFNPFFTTRQPGEGTGLGLYLSRQSIQRLGGNLSLSSRPGEPTVFAMQLPREV